MNNETCLMKVKRIVDYRDIKVNSEIMIYFSRLKTFTIERFSHRNQTKVQKCLSGLRCSEVVCTRLPY